MRETTTDRQHRDEDEATGLADGAIDRSWPPSSRTFDRLASLGIGDRRAAALFGVHPATYRAWRRRHRAGPPGLLPADPVGDAAAFGFDPAAGWPVFIRFEDDARAARPAGGGRLPRPMTVVEGASTLALLVA